MTIRCYVPFPYTAWNSFKRLIERADTTLKEKFEACQMVYEAETRESSVSVGHVEFQKELTWQKPMLRSVTKQHMGKFKDQEMLKLQRIKFFGVLSML